MFIRLSEDFLTLSDSEVCRHGELIEQLLFAHHKRYHLIYMSPKMIDHLRSRIDFGPYAKRVLAIVIRRFQDYGASLRHAQFACVILPFSSQRAIGLFGKDFHLRAEQVSEWLEQVPHLYVENGASDGLFYRFILRSAVRAIGGSPDHLTVRAFHGGGNPLGVVMETLIGDNIQGMCVCDRDAMQIVPPFVKDTTSEHAFKSLLKMKVIDDNSNSDSRNPFFAFHITDGWSLKNYIGPNMLDFYFTTHPQSSASRRGFLDVFDKFPVLDSGQMAEWWSINLKSYDQSHENIVIGLESRFGFGAVNEERCRIIAALAIPDDVVSFVAQNCMAGRHHRGLLTAFEKDMKNQRYKNVVIELVRKAVLSLSADYTVQLA